MSTEEPVLYVGIRNPYDADARARQRELDRDGRSPRTSAEWQKWWRTLPAPVRADEAATIVFLIGLKSTGSSAKQVARDVLSDIRDACDEVASRSIAVKKELDAIVGDSSTMQEVRRTCWAASFGERLDTVNNMTRLFQTTPVLINGETGTGKEMIARALSRSMKGSVKNAEWQPAPYDAVHLASLPPDLVQSELFGHEKGAFSGAITEREGVFARCHGGVVFLDEVAELPPSTQVALLRTLQEGKARRLGGNDSLDAAPRVVSATHQDLDELVADGKFREDLLFRLSSVVIRVPPLRERAEDIPALVERAVNDLVTASSRPELHDKCDQFLRKQSGYDWPGNVRELHALVRTIALGLTPTLRRRRSAQHQTMKVPSGIASGTSTLKDVTSWYARHAHERAGTIDRAARTLGINRSTLRRRLKQGGR